MQAPVAQLDRASVYGTEGREFESLRAHSQNFLVSKAFAVGAESLPTWIRSWVPLVGTTSVSEGSSLAADLRTCERLGRSRGRSPLTPTSGLRRSKACGPSGPMASFRSKRCNCRRASNPRRAGRVNIAGEMRVRPRRRVWDWWSVPARAWLLHAYSGHGEFVAASHKDRQSVTSYGPSSRQGTGRSPSGAARFARSLGNAIATHSEFIRTRTSVACLPFH